MPFRRKTPFCSATSQCVSEEPLSLVWSRFRLPPRRAVLFCGRLWRHTEVLHLPPSRGTVFALSRRTQLCRCRRPPRREFNSTHGHTPTPEGMATPEGIVRSQNTNQSFPKDCLVSRQSATPEGTTFQRVTYRPPKRTVAPPSSTSPRGSFRRFCWSCCAKSEDPQRSEDHCASHPCDWSPRFRKSAGYSS